MPMLSLIPLAADASQAQGPDLTRYFAVLGGVALVLILLAVGLKRLVSHSTFGIGRQRKGMQVLEVVSLGARRQMAVVRCYDRTFALGLGEKQVALIAELDSELVQHESATPEAVPSEELRPRARRQRPAAPAKPQAPVTASSADPFEALLERAQAQLQARRAAESRSSAAPATPSPVAQQAAPSGAPIQASGGLQELC